MNNELNESMTTRESDDVSEKLATFGMYINYDDVEKAISRLEKNGILRKDISILAPDFKGGRDFVYQQKTSVKEGAVIGALIGFFVLGLVGFLLGLGFFNQVETLSQSNMVSRIPAWVVSTVVGCIVGILYGAASGALVGIGTPKGAAKRYGFYLKEGAMMLSVYLQKESDRARVNEILERTHAQDISELNESEIWQTIVPEKNKLAYN